MMVLETYWLCFYVDERKFSTDVLCFVYHCMLIFLLTFLRVLSGCLIVVVTNRSLRYCVGPCNCYDMHPCCNDSPEAYRA